MRAFINWDTDETAAFLFERRVPRIITIATFAIFVLAALSVALYAVFAVTDNTQKDYILKKLLPILLIPIVLISLMFIQNVFFKTANVVGIQLQRIFEERKAITQKIEESKAPDIFYTIQSNLNQLTEYYTINKGQARSSFRFSIGSIVAGLITIIAGIWLFYFNSLNIQLTFISGISGVLLEFIGGAYFFMYKKSLEQVNLFYAQLIKIQDTMLSISLSNSISNEEKKQLYKRK